jgi:hypothetical protein
MCWLVQICRGQALFRIAIPPFALLTSLSCFTLRLKPRKTGNILKIFFAGVLMAADPIRHFLFFGWW